MPREPGDLRMKRTRTLLLVSASLAFLAAPRSDAAADEQFPAELVDFEPYQGNPVFAGAGKDTWDRTIRERGYIIREGDTYHLWYTGYNHNRSDAHYRRTMSLGNAYYHACVHRPWRDWTTNVAVSTDLIHWKKCPNNPILTGGKSSGAWSTTAANISSTRLIRT